MSEKSGTRGGEFAEYVYSLLAMITDPQQFGKSFFENEDDKITTLIKSGGYLFIAATIMIVVSANSTYSSLKDFDLKQNFISFLLIGTPAALLLMLLLRISGNSRSFLDCASFVLLFFALNCGGAAITFAIDGLEQGGQGFVKALYMIISLYIALYLSPKIFSGMTQLGYLKSVVFVIVGLVGGVIISSLSLGVIFPTLYFD